MNKNIVELAMLFKERDNKQWSGVQVGKVVSGFPGIKIRLGEVILLEKDMLIFASSVVNNLSVSDKVIVIPSSNEQIYYVIDKVVTL